MESLGPINRCIHDHTTTYRGEEPPENPRLGDLLPCTVAPPVASRSSSFTTDVVSTVVNAWIMDAWNCTYLLKVPATHPDECRKEQEAVGIHTKNRVGLKIRASQPSLRTSSQQRLLIHSANTPALRKWGLLEVVSGPLVSLAEADKSEITKYGIDQLVTV